MITTADLLQVQEAINGTVRYEVKEARAEFRAEIAKLQASQQLHEARANAQASDLARLDERTKALSTRSSLLGSLTKKQKAGLWSMAVAIGSVLLEKAWSAAAWLFTVYTQGVRP
jgi:hypothetical protein